MASRAQQRLARLSDKSRSQIEAEIDAWIFNERDRIILKRRLLDGITYERLAEEVGLSTRQTKAIVYKMEERLFRHTPV